MQINVALTQTYDNGGTAQFAFMADSAAQAHATVKALMAEVYPAETSAAAPKTETKAAATPKPDAKTASSPSGAKPPSAAPKGDAPAVPEYAQVKERILAVAKKDREMTAAMLARFGVKNGTELLPEQYADLIAMADKVLAGELDPRDSITADDMA